MKTNNREVTIKGSRCNYRSDRLDPFDWAGGKLLLTEYRLLFKPYSLNLRNKEESIQLKDIESIEAKYSDFISNKVTVLLNDGSTKEFRVPGRSDWIKVLEKAIRTNKKARDENWDSRKGMPIVQKSLNWYIKMIIQIVLLALFVTALAFIFQRLLS
jgi:ATP-dependent Zn protease